MSSFLYELGRTAFRHKKTFISIWLVILALLLVFVALFYKPFESEFKMPGSEAQDALDSMEQTFPSASGASGSIVVVVPAGQRVDHDPYKQDIKDTVDKLSDMDHIESATSPFNQMIKGAVSDNKRAAIINVGYDTDVFSLPEDTGDKLQGVAGELKKELPKGTQVEPGGQVFQMTNPGVSPTEGIGVIVAFIVLAITFGSFLAAGLPLITAIFGVGIGMMIIVSMTAFMKVSSTTPVLAMMLGLAVGIDYALFIVSRARQNMRKGQNPEEATAQAVATAGSAVIFAGTTVIIALVGLSIVRMQFLTIMGVAAAITVAFAVLISLTMVPAIMGFVGKRISPLRKAQKRAVREARAAGADKLAAEAEGWQVYEEARKKTEAVEAAEAHAELVAAGHARADDPNAPAPVAEQSGKKAKRSFAERFYSGWVGIATKIPILTVLIIVMGLALFIIPTSKIQLAMPNNGTEAQGTPARVTYDLTEKYFGAGYNGPLIVLVDGLSTSDDPMDDLDDMKKDIEKVDGVKGVMAAVPNADATVGMIQVVPTTGPSDKETEQTVLNLRDLHDHFKDKYGLDTSVTGQTALYLDISTQLTKALFPFGAFVVGLSFLLLMMVFRSIAVPIKATLGFLLSVITSFGVTTYIFVEGHGLDLLNIEKPGPIISFLPIIVMGILFGLAMDYEVFLVSGMREAFAHGATPRQAILRGFKGSASVVTAAAIIMFSVFFAFVPEGEAIIKSIGVSLAVGVFTDAFIVRMTLVPAVMALLGKGAWWIPKWLDKILPHFDVEGEGLYHQVKLKNWPEPDAKHVVYGEGLTLGSKRHPVFRDVDVAIDPGQVLVVTGQATPGLLLALSGRASLDGGELKIGPYVMPEQANKVRNRTPYLNLDPGDDSMIPSISNLHDQANKPPRLVVVDRADQPRDHDTALALQQLLAAALSSGSAVLLGLTNPRATWMLPEGQPFAVLDLDQAAQAPQADYGEPTALMEPVTHGAGPDSGQAPVTQPMNSFDTNSGNGPEGAR